MAAWDALVDAALERLAGRKLLFSTHFIALDGPTLPADPVTFPGTGPWDRATVEARLDGASLQEWLTEDGEANSKDDEVMNRKLVLFSGNDYICLSSHPAVRDTAAKAAQEYGMGPRGSGVLCGHTTYHKLVEQSLAELKKKEGCVLCPTGFSANLALMIALGSVASLLAAGKKPGEHEKIAIFSDELNHASIIDGIRLAQRQQEAVVFVYRHCDTTHLESLLSDCTLEKKVVVTDSLFSMDGDFAPLPELVELREKYGFLLIVDDAHATLVCGENGGGAAEMFGCENDIDITVGTLSKAVGCQGGFIACSNRWRKLILSRGRSFIFSTTLPLPIVAAVIVAVNVSKKEGWRRSVLWENVRYFASLTKLDNITSPIISIVVGNEEEVLKAGRHLLRSGFVTIPVRPPIVPSNSCRLRISLSTGHTSEDIERLVDALRPWLPDSKQAAAAPKIVSNGAHKERVHVDEIVSNGAHKERVAVDGIVSNGAFKT